MCSAADVQGLGTQECLSFTQGSDGTGLWGGVMSYMEYLDEICNEYLSRPYKVSEVFAELSDEKVADLLENSPKLKEALLDELRTWKGLQTKAYDLEAFYRGSDREDKAYEQRRQDNIDRRNV